MGSGYATTTVKEYGFDVARDFKGDMEAAKEGRQADWEGFLRQTLSQDRRGDFIRLRASTWNSFSKDEKESLITNYVQHISELPGQLINSDKNISHDIFGGGFKFSATLQWQLSPVIDGKVTWDIAVDGEGQIQKLTGTFYQNGEF